MPVGLQYSLNRPAVIRVWMLPYLLLCLTTALPAAALAQDQEVQARLERMEQIIQQQQQELEAQRKQLADQMTLIRQLQEQQAAEVAPDSTAKAGQPSPEGTVEEAPANAQDQPAVSARTAAAPTGEERKDGAGGGQEAAVAELERREEAGTASQQVTAQATLYDPSSTVYDPNFPGAWHLPGTTSAMRLGGYVNMSYVNSFDPLTLPDRFIVGSIPPAGTEVPGAYQGATVTAAQSRVNLEMREQTTHGELRAFIEGDFEGNDDTFRLRHAYGQYRSLLAGKTWSNLVDVQNQPEGVDFEGINGQVLVRQSQFRMFPKVGQDLRLRISMENPQTDIVNGTGATNLSDFVFSLDKLPFGGLGAWNYRVGVVLRQLQGQFVMAGDPDDADYPVESTLGWGVTTSGRTSFSRFGDNDFLLWQITYGQGVGRYINDLGTIGGGDAVFDPAGNLKALPVFAGYLSYQHTWPWKFKFLQDWPGLFRSNLTFSWVDIDNYEFEDGGDYNYTLRGSANLMYFPTESVRFGAEYLWGQRVNKDGSKGDATQMQFSIRYDF